MKKLLTITLLSASMVGFGQEQSTSKPLTYAPTIPADSTYTVTKNTSGAPIPEDVILEINKYRMKDDYLWHVNEEIEILIHGSEQ